MERLFSAVTDAFVGAVLSAVLAGPMALAVDAEWWRVFIAGMWVFMLTLWSSRVVDD